MRGRKGEHPDGRGSGEELGGGEGGKWSSGDDDNVREKNLFSVKGGEKRALSRL